MPNSVDGTASTRIRTTPSSEDRPVFQLENISLSAKAYVPATEAEIDCVVTGLSADGACIETPLASSIGSEIVLYIEGFDRFSATVAWTREDRVYVIFNCSQSKRARTAEKIACRLNGQPIPPGASRSAQRSALHSVRTFKRRNGDTVDFEVIDISLTGASLRTKCRPAIDEIITIGTIEGRVSRHFDDGIAVEFSRRTSPGLSFTR